MKKILVLGSGGREHALAHTFKRQGNDVYCFPGNGGTKDLCLPLESKEMTIDDHASLANFVEKQKIDLTVVGPEAPLEKGIADVFAQRGLALFGPSKHASRIECNKAWSKSFMQKYGIPTADFVICQKFETALSAVESLFHEWGGIVIKPNGLTAGKGVVVCETIEEAKNALRMIMEEKKFGLAGEQVILEQPLVGKEISWMVFCDGKETRAMVPSKDHKRLYSGGKGPNTGGIGAYTLTAHVQKELVEDIEKRTIEGLIKEGIHYCGVLYIGLILTKEGPKVLEYNCRFGDPEAQVVLPLLETSLAEIMMACVQGNLNKKEFCWKKEEVCSVVMVSGGYPNAYEVGYPISGVDTAEEMDDVTVFQAGTTYQDNQLVTSGGRVLNVTARAKTLEQAIEKAYLAIKPIRFQGAYYREDIGQSVSFFRELQIAR